MIAVHPSILEKNGVKEFAILPYKDFFKIKEELEDYEDLKLLRQAKIEETNSPTVSFDEAKTILNKNRANKKILPSARKAPANL